MSTLSAISAAEPAAIPAPNSATNMAAFKRRTATSSRFWSAWRASRSSSLPLCAQQSCISAPFLHLSSLTQVRQGSGEKDMAGIWRNGVALITASILGACASTAPRHEQKPSARYTFWRPAPVQGAAEPSDVVKQAPPEAWRRIAPENLLVMDLKDGARVVIELAPDFAPVHIANIRAFARAGWWNAATIYRVQDNYVSQWGNGDATGPLPAGVVKQRPAEYDRALAGLPFRPLGYPDSYAPVTGHSDS